jgi:hypothetical protein
MFERSVSEKVEAVKALNSFYAWDGRQELLLSPRCSPLGCGEEKGDKSSNKFAEDIPFWNIQKIIVYAIFSLWNRYTDCVGLGIVF